MLRRAASLGSGYGWRAGEDAVGACTESLGSESGDVGGGGDDDAEIIGQHQQLAPGAAAGEEEERAERPRAASPERRGARARRLPPAMPRAAEALFMRAERRGGRLILTEVRAAERRRPEVFRASRDSGRLRLRFADDAAPSAPAGEPGEESGQNQKAGAVATVAATAVPGSGCCNGGEFCQVAAGAGRRDVEVGAVMGI